MFTAIFSEPQRDLLVELLESESHRLTVEIRHTDHREARELLRQRQRNIDLLLERLRETSAEVPMAEN